MLMASSGVREGVIHSIKPAHIERIEDVYKIMVYKNDPEEAVNQPTTTVL
jgi:hypothetical protein